MTIDNLVNILGNLQTAHNASVPGTLRHVDQLMTERQTNFSLRSLGFYTPDGNLYFMDGEIPKLAMTREADNLVLRHLNDEVNSSYNQLTETGNFFPDPREAEQAIKASATEVFDLTQLQLKKHDAEFSYLAISTTQYDELNPEQRRLAERVYGKGDDFVANMTMLKEAHIDNTKIFVLNPDYVQEHAKGSPIGRASWLNIFSNDSVFIANDRDVYINVRVRGVRREVVAEGGAAKIEAVPSAPVAPSEIRTPTLAETLAVSRQYVPDVAWKAFEVDMGNLYKP